MNAIDITQATAYEQYLPEALRNIAGFIGLPASLNLVKHYGGINQLYVPEKITPEHHLAKSLGLKAAKILSEHFGKEYISVPRAAVALRAIRDDEIRQRHTGGESASILAREYSLTERQVWTIIGQGDYVDVNDRQESLFG